MTLETSRKIRVHRLIKLYSIINNYSPVYLQNIIAHLIPYHKHNTRLQKMLSFHLSKIFFTVLDWNSLANDINNFPSLFTCKIRLMRLVNCKALLFNYDIDRKYSSSFYHVYVNIDAF